MVGGRSVQDSQLVAGDQPLRVRARCDRTRRDCTGAQDSPWDRTASRRCFERSTRRFGTRRRGCRRTKNGGEHGRSLPSRRGGRPLRIGRRNGIAKRGRRGVVSRRSGSERGSLAGALVDRSPRSDRIRHGSRCNTSRVPACATRSLTAEQAIGATFLLRSVVSGIVVCMGRHWACRMRCIFETLWSFRVQVLHLPQEF